MLCTLKKCCKMFSKLYLKKNCEYITQVGKVIKRKSIKNRKIKKKIVKAIFIN